MKRTKQQLINDSGERQMRAVFESVGWAVRTLDKDIGIDFEVEIFDNFKSTGVFFKVQLKSSESTRYVNSRTVISQPLRVASARYLSAEVRLPVVLIHADVKNKKTFWCVPQLMRTELERIISLKRGKITLRIPIGNELPETLVKLIDTITKVEQVLASRLIVSTPTETFVRSIDKQVDADELTRDFQDKADTLKLLQAHRLAQSRRHAEAVEKAQKVFANSDASILTKFNALLTIEEAELLAAMYNQAPQQNYYRIRLTTGRKLKLLTKKGPRILKFHALVVWETAKLQRLTHIYHGLLLNWVAHKRKENVIWKAQLVFERTNVYRQVLAKYNQCIRLANYAARINGRADIPRLLMRIVSAIAHFIGNLESEHLEEIAGNFSASALQICKLAAAIANATKDDEGLFTVASKALMTKHAATGNAVDFAYETIGKISDDDTKQRAQDLVSRIIRSYQGEKLEGPIKTTHRQVYENMATALGVDLSNQNNQFPKWFDSDLTIWIQAEYS